MTISPSALDTLTKTIWGEARGEGREGMIAVAWVILNRASIGGWWGNSIETVCLKPWQFSCWNANDPNAPYMRGRKAIPGHQYAAAREAALAAVEGHEKDPTLGATHYYAPKAVKEPAWAKSATKTTQIGGHIFFKNVK
ncbi:cell wall hydrolase [Pseudomonas aeruginosa]|uniref:cell wall hydrolase n=1 Tax=Pseudomonas aeruginosa TaxID=287 RepID=UPI003982C33B